MAADKSPNLTTPLDRWFLEQERGEMARLAAALGVSRQYVWQARHSIQALPFDRAQELARLTGLALDQIPYIRKDTHWPKLVRRPRGR
jgi:hypothetical protein